VYRQEDNRQVTYAYSWTLEKRVVTTTLLDIQKRSCSGGSSYIQHHDTTFHRQHCENCVSYRSKHILVETYIFKEAQTTM
jgi:hypothetical protein